MPCRSRLSALGTAASVFGGYLDGLIEILTALSKSRFRTSHRPDASGGNNRPYRAIEESKS